MQANDYYERMDFYLEEDFQTLLSFFQNFGGKSKNEIAVWLLNLRPKLKPLVQISLSDDIAILSDKIIKILFARMILMLENQLGNKSDAWLLLDVISESFLRAFKNQDEIELTFLLNCSRALVDSSKSVERLIDYLIAYRKIKAFTQPIIQMDEWTLVQESMTFFQDILACEEVKNALQKYIQHEMTKENDYDQEIQVLDCIKVLSGMKIEISPPEHLFNAMVGRGNKVYLNLSRMFSECKTNEQKKSCLVKIFFHEGAHELIRTFGKNQYASFTHRGKFREIESMEAGYCLEKLIIGEYKKKYWISSVHMKILTKASYDSLPIFNLGDANNMSDRMIAEFCSGICSFEFPLQFYLFE